MVPVDEVVTTMADDGLGRWLTAVRSRVGDRLADLWWAFLVRGVLALLLGLFALFWPSASLAVLIRLVGAYCLLDGVTGLVGALHAGDHRAHLLQALVGLCVGGILLFWPEGSVRTPLVIFGIWAVATGVSQILAGRERAVADSERTPLTTVGWVITTIGGILILWPGMGVVAIAWMIGVVALLLAALLLWLARRINRLRARLAMPT